MTQTCDPTSKGCSGRKLENLTPYWATQRLSLKEQSKLGLGIITQWQNACRLDPAQPLVSEVGEMINDLFKIMWDLGEGGMLIRQVTFKVQMLLMGPNHIV